MIEEKNIAVEPAAKSVTGRIIGGNTGRIIASVPSHESTGEIPFVPAFDLLEQELARTGLSSSEVAAIAGALWMATSDSGPTVPSAWSINAKLAAVSQRG